MARFGMDEKRPVEHKVLEEAYAETVPHQHVPGRAFNVADPADRLVHVIGGGFFNEPKYYDSNRSAEAFAAELLADGKISSRILDESGLTEQAREVLETAMAVAHSENPEDLLVIAAWARDPRHGLRLRTTPQIMLAIAAAHPETKGFVARYGPAIMRRPDEICQVFAAFRHMFQKKGESHKGSLPHGLRKAFARTFAGASPYELVKYDRTSRPSLRDVLLMIGGSRKFRNLGENYPIHKSLFEYLVNGKVLDDALPMLKAREKFFASKTHDDLPGLIAQAGLTWEDITSHLGNSKEVWEAAIPVMGEMALTRNLRNFEEAKISDDAWAAVAANLEKVEETVQLPFRFFSADREVSGAKAKTIVAKMLDRACAALPDLPGVTLALCDNSGSATGTSVSGKGGLVVSDAGNMLEAVLAKRLGTRAICGVFGDRLIWVPFNAADSALSIKKSIDETARSGKDGLGRTSGRSGVGGETETGLWWALKDITDNKVRVDRIILLSDLCCYTQGDVNCGHDMKKWFGPNATVQGMVDNYRRVVNEDVKVYSINLSGHQQSQLRKDEKNHLLSGWSEKIFDIILGLENPELPQAELPTVALLRKRYQIA